jgi:hypothetical protein
MRITQKDNHTYVIADEGNYVGLKNKRSIYGEALSLGIGVTPDDVTEEPIANWQPEEPAEPVSGEI